MKIIYADPPYLGCGRYYDNKHESSREYDDIEKHMDLIEELKLQSDLWIYSCSARTLKKVFLLLPANVRIASWHKHRQGYSSWEPVIFSDIRPIKGWCDSFEWRHQNKSGLIGAKPVQFYYWLFQGVGLTAADTWIEKFPGSYNGEHAYNQYLNQSSLFVNHQHQLEAVIND